MNHTRGPWQIVTDPEKAGDNWLVCFGHTYVIETDHIKADECGDEMSDAHLVAAAPDLLAALQAFVEIRPFKEAAARHSAIFKVWHDAQLAIARATGQTNADADTPAR